LAWRGKDCSILPSLIANLVIEISKTEKGERRRGKPRIVLVLIAKATGGRRVQGEFWENMGIKNVW